MDTPPTHEPEEAEEKHRIFGTHIGDLGVIAIAAMCTIALIALLILPSPFVALEKAQAAAEKAQKQQKIDEAVASGEVSVGIIPSRKH